MILNRNKSRNIISIVLTGILLTLTAVVIIAPDSSKLSWISNNAPQIMFIMLVVSFIFLALDQKTMMVIGMICTAIIAIYLKSASNEEGFLSNEYGENYFEIIYLVLDPDNTVADDLFEITSGLDADAIVVQNYDEEWEALFRSNLGLYYPHNYGFKTPDNTGAGIFTRNKILRINNLKINDDTNLQTVIDFEESKIQLLAAKLPEDVVAEEEKYHEYLQSLASEVRDSRNPVLLMGDFKKVYWSKELINFRKQAQLENSRPSIGIENLNPEVHFFHSRKLICTGFREIYGDENKLFGIFAAYTLK